MSHVESVESIKTWGCAPVLSSQSGLICGNLSLNVVISPGWARIRSKTRALLHPIVTRPGQSFVKFSAINSAKLSAEARSLYEMSKITSVCAWLGGRRRWVIRVWTWSAPNCSENTLCLQHWAALDTGARVPENISHGAARQQEMGKWNKSEQGLLTPKYLRFWSMVLVNLCWFKQICIRMNRCLGLGRFIVLMFEEGAVSCDWKRCKSHRDKSGRYCQELNILRFVIGGGQKSKLN